MTWNNEYIKANDIYNSLHLGIPSKVCIKTNTSVQLCHLLCVNSQ
jgi:hypothetical protein